jgi:hypothetical protein
MGGLEELLGLNEARNDLRENQPARPARGSGATEIGDTASGCSITLLSRAADLWLKATRLRGQILQTTVSQYDFTKNRKCANAKRDEIGEEADVYSRRSDGQQFEEQQRTSFHDPAVSPGC